MSWMGASDGDIRSGRWPCYELHMSRIVYRPRRVAHVTLTHLGEVSLSLTPNQRVFVAQSHSHHLTKIKCVSAIKEWYDNTRFVINASKSHGCHH